MTIRGILTGSAVTALLALQPLAANATPASGANEPPNWTPSNIGAADWPCGSSPTSNGPGGTDVKNPIWLRDGPRAGCGNASGYTLQKGTRLGGWCYAYNESGNKWFYVSVGGAAPHGWIYEKNVTADSSSINRPCA
ncbi:hypothetical protein [Streptomyces coeruleorubidus]|uniref:hypothetical protein n=1 Tax=Streptomyces coeruleorubidus TaxID=116188 RepID=UPI0033B849F2